MSFLARGKADTRARKDTEPTARHAAPELVPAVGGNYARRMRRRRTRPGAATRPSGVVTGGRLAPFTERWVRQPTRPVAAALEVAHGCITLAPCDVFGPPKTSPGAGSSSRSIRYLSPSACLPFQARGKVPDRPTATRACLPFQARGKVPDRSPVLTAPSPLRRREKVRGPVGDCRGWNRSSSVVICELDRCASTAQRRGNA